jgi:hypothetical protein
VDAKTLPGNDSHTEIRAAYGIREDTGGLGDNLHAPAECLPTRGCGPIEEWDFRWDGEPPDWTTPLIDARAKELLWQAAQRDLVLTAWKGDLRLVGKVTLPALVMVNEDIHVTSNATLRAPAIMQVNGEVRVYDTATMHAPSLVTIESDLRLLDNGVLQADALTTVGRDLYVFDNAALFANSLTRVAGHMYTDTTATLRVPKLPRTSP